MSAGWVAGCVRAQGLARRRIGTAGVRGLARSGSLDMAVATLRISPYGRFVTPGSGLAGAQRGVLAGLLWHLRVLAGWLPPEGVRSLRAMAAWFEIANVDEHLRRLAGQPAEPPYQLGMLASAWPRLAATTSPPRLREELNRSVWGDPGGHAPREIALGMRVAWAQRVADRVPLAHPWAAGALALLVAAERLAAHRRLPERAAAGVDHLLGRGWTATTSVAELRRALPATARWALRGTERTDQLWQAEVRWWQRLRTDGLQLAGGSGYGMDRPVGAVALLAADAWQVRAALELAARPVTPEVGIDAIA